MGVRSTLFKVLLVEIVFDPIESSLHGTLHYIQTADFHSFSLFLSSNNETQNLNHKLKA